MKKFVKVSLITAGILFAAGCLLGMVSLIGGKQQLKRYIREELELGQKVEAVIDAIGNGIYIGSDGVGFSFDDDTEAFVVAGEETVAERNEEIAAEGITGLSLDLGAGTFIIAEKEEADGIIDLSMSGVGSCDYSVKDGILYVEGFKGIKIAVNSSDTNKIVMRIPKGCRFTEVTAEIGAGIMEVKDLNVREFDAAVGAGILTVEGLKADEFDVEIGAGQLTASRSEVKDAEFAVGMGECIYKGSITGNLDLECDMGNVELTLSGKEEDHNYEVECAAGNIEIGNFSFSALAAERSVNNNTTSTFDIECNMGNIEISFEE